MAHSAGLMQLLQAGFLCNERTIKKNLLMALMLMMLCGCSQAAKSSSELIEEDIRNSDREACFIHAQEAANEGLDEAEAKILMASCYMAPVKDGSSIKVTPVDDQESVLILLSDALASDPDNEDIKAKAEEVWENVRKIYDAFDDSIRLDWPSFGDAYAERERFKVTAENFWISDYYEQVELVTKVNGSNISRQEGGETTDGGGYLYTRNLIYDKLDRQICDWSCYYAYQAIDENGSNLGDYYTISIYDHDRFTCKRKDIITSSKKRYEGMSPYGIIMMSKYRQTNFINMFEYDANGQIVKSYAYVMEDGTLTYQDEAVEYGAFD